MSCYTTIRSNCPPLPNNPCPIYVNAKCVSYTGANLIHIGVNTNDRLDVILQKIDAHFIDLGGTVTSVGLTSSDITVGGAASPITSSGVFTLTLPDVNSNVGTFNTLTVNAKGQVTAASNIAYITSVPINTLIAATGTNTISNANFQQEWQWPTLSSTSGLRLSSTSTLASGNSQTILSVLLSGANATSGQTTAAIRGTNSHTGTGALNYGVHGVASGGDVCYGVIGESTSATSQSYGGYFKGTGGASINVGIYAEAEGAGSAAGYFLSNSVDAIINIVRANSVGYSAISYTTVGPNSWTAGHRISDGAFEFNTSPTFTGARVLQLAQTGEITFNNIYTFPITDGLANQVLTTDGLGTITWQNGGGGGGGSTVSITFNATTDWGSPSGGLYSFAYTHSLGTASIGVTIWDETSTPIQTIPQVTERTNNNVLTIKVPDSPDQRFAGRIVITS